MDNFLLQSVIYLMAAVLAVPLAMRFGLGSVLGYLMAGVVVGPLIRKVGSETTELQHYAEFGVVMMLFLIGLELTPRTLWDMRKKLVGLGGAQITLTLAGVAVAASLLGFNWRESLAIGAVFAMSSTAIVMQTLAERGLVKLEGGRSAFAVLLAQDIAVIPILAMIPLLAYYNPEPHDRLLLDALPDWAAPIVVPGAVIAVVMGGRFLTRPLFRFIHQAHLRELYPATALAIVTGVALLMTMVGLSPALGTFVAGVALANTEFRHELESSIEPFKGLLLGLFFITVGAGINLGALAGEPLLILGLTLALMALKFAILWVIAIVGGLKGEDRWLFSLGLAQAGEFGFVLVALATRGFILSEQTSSRVLLVIALSMLLTPLAFILHRKIAAVLKSRGRTADFDTIDEQHAVLIAGIGRFGQVVNRLVTSSGFRTTVIDNDLDTVEMIRKFGVKSFFGDPTRPDLLHAAGLANAEILVVTLDDPAAITRIVTYARSQRPDLHIIARARDRMHVFQLYRAGANQIVRETFDSSLRVGRYVLEKMGLSEFEAHDAEMTFFQMDRAAMADLAKLWDPDLPVAENHPYIERAKALNAEMENVIFSQLNRTRESKDAAG